MRFSFATILFDLDNLRILYVYNRTGIRWLLVAESLCAVGYVPKYYIDFRQQVSGLSDLMKGGPPAPPPLPSLTHL